MTSSAHGHIRIAAMLCVLLLVPSVVASGSEANVLVHNGVFHEGGDLWVLRLADVNTTQAPSLQVHSKEGFGFYFETTTAVVSNASTAPPGGREFIGSKADPLQGMSLTTLGSGDSFDVRVLPVGHARYESTVHGVSYLGGMPDLGMDQDGNFVEANSDHKQTDPTGSYPQMARARVDHPIIVTTARGGASNIVVHGDFMVDIIGVTASIDSLDGTPIVYETGVEDNVQGEGAIRVGSYTERFVRLVFFDATLTLQHTGTLGRTAQWASTGTVVESADGLVELEGLDHETSTFTDDFTALLTPTDTGYFTVDVQDRSAMAPTASSWIAPAGFNPLPVALALVAVALAVFGVRRLRPAPELAHMESALEAGAFDRAARLASRILRKDPADESARLGRAIALSRIGRPERVVQDLKPYLDENEPSDGTMHYVLGLALRDLGREDDARSALGKAVERTPALAQQLPGSPAPSRNGLGGDAQGYT